MSWLHDKTTEMLERIEEAKRLKAFPFFRPFENLGPRVKVGDGSYVNFTSNDYLGLSQHPKLIAAACAGTRRYGTGLGSARPQATSVRHDELERRLAMWTHNEAAAVFTTGYQAIVGTLATFLDNETTVALDKLSHASIIDGVMLAQGLNPDLEVRWFNHNKPDSLEKVLQTAANTKLLVVVEGLYSVDGDLAPLADFITVCKKYSAAIMVDDAHGLGTLGPTGRGVGEVFGVLDEIDLLIGTFSKSFGTVGGFVCADRALVDYMKLSARSFVFSASLPLAQVDAAIAALDIIESDASYRERLAHNRDFFRGGLAEIGADIGDSTTHITPILIRDEILCMTAAAAMFQAAGVIMMPFIYPGVPKGTERLRCNVTAAHTEAQIGYTLEALAKVGEHVGFLPGGARTFNTNLTKAKWLATSKLEGARNAGLPFIRSELGGAATWIRERLGRRAT
ncbi:MAG TPA: aminotransferase class I/II-fold pyridoxal phosphate-dependent enzyme [Kofleriaceae bacterium]|jgi:glycine C-acetyltransferase